MRGNRFISDLLVVHDERMAGLAMHDFAGRTPLDVPPFGLAAAAIAEDDCPVAAHPGSVAALRGVVAPIGDW